MDRVPGTETGSGSKIFGTGPGTGWTGSKIFETGPGPGWTGSGSEPAETGSGTGEPVFLLTPSWKNLT